MKAEVSTIITVQLAYARCDDFIETRVFDGSEPISKIKEWADSLKARQMEGTEMSNINIRFKED